jgi:DNA adenine methylase
MPVTDTPKTTTLTPWFGSNRTNAHRPGELLRGCSWIGVPFGGGMSELRHLTARTIVVGDLHRHQINLAKVVSHPVLGPKLYRSLRRMAFHPEVLAEAQGRCRAKDDLLQRASALPSLFGTKRSFVENDGPSLQWAEDYFVACWMTRSGLAGTDGELTGGLSVRWSASGGDSVVRYRSAVAGLVAWRKILSRATFQCIDCFEFLNAAKDAPGHGFYIDAPWPDAGDGYKHAFSEAHQRRLAKTLAEFESAKVVVRYGRHPLIEELYPRPQWTWLDITGRTQANNDLDEVLILNKAVP